MQCVDYQYYIGQQSSDNSNSDGNNDSVTSAYRDATIALSVVAGLAILLLIAIVLFIVRMKKSSPLSLSGNSSLTNSSSAL